MFERAAAPFAHTRAIAIDEDGLRILQSVDLLDAALADMRTRIRLNLEHRGRVFLSFSLHGRARQGLPGMAFFHQPRLEQVLRDGMRRFPGHVRLVAGRSLTGLEQDRDGVVAITDDGRRVRARFLLGCDGGASSVRRLLGIRLVGRSLPEPWIDIQARAPRLERPDDVLDFTYVAEPGRPAVDCASPLGHRRWEFRLNRGEPPDAALTPAGLRRLLASRGVDAAGVEVLQRWSYVFHAREAERWRHGRVFLLGDAAHLMPPYAGQGLSSGLRDAACLVWRLAAVAAGAPVALLDQYESERRPDLRRRARLSLLIGAIIGVRRESVARLRDAAFRMAMRLPVSRRYLAEFRIKPDWVCGPGLLAPRGRGASPAGHLLWQPRVGSLTGRMRLDEALGGGWAFLSWQRSCRPAALRGPGLRELVVRPCGERPRAADEVVDLEDRLRLQFRRYRARGLLVRPDRFIYGSDRDRLDDPLLLACLDAPARRRDEAEPGAHRRRSTTA